MAVHHLHHLHYRHFYLLLLIWFFILNLRLGCLAYPFLHRPFPLLPDWFHQCFYSAHWLDFFAWCVRLNSLLVGFQTHLKSIIFFIHSWDICTVWCRHNLSILAHVQWCLCLLSSTACISTLVGIIMSHLYLFFFTVSLSLSSVCCLLFFYHTGS